MSLYNATSINHLILTNFTNLFNYLDGFGCTSRLRTAQSDAVSGPIESFSTAQQTRIMLQHKAFKYSPLNYATNSIRLLRVLPGSLRSGIIQCEIWHASTDSTYRCLSYVWGPDGDMEEILLNGREFRCRRNLHDFLKVMCKNNTTETLWIDALCIDQTNLPERDHQVVQMGFIYSRATGVIAWLGCDERLADFFRFTIRLTKATRGRSDAEAYWKREQGYLQVQAGWTAFWTNAYWTRAWITQEIFLARSINLLANDAEISHGEIKSIATIFPSASKAIIATAKRGSDIARMLETYMRIMAGYESARTGLKRNLIDLLHVLLFRESHLPRDHIYSLRGIASDGNLIPIDYGSSDNQFVDSFCALLAKSRSLCICALACMVHALPTDATQQLPVLKFTMLSQSPSPSKVRRSRKRTARRRLCVRCNACVSMQNAQDHLICLGAECSQFTGTHLSLRTDPEGRRPTTLSIVPETANNFGLDIERLHTSAEFNAKVTGLSKVCIDVRLHSLLRFTSHLEKSTGEICQQALRRCARYKLCRELPRVAS